MLYTCVIIYRLQEQDSGDTTHRCVSGWFRYELRLTKLLSDEGFLSIHLMLAVFRRSTHAVAHQESCAHRQSYFTESEGHDGEGIERAWDTLKINA